MKEQFDGQLALSEIVRQYVSALMVTSEELPFDYYSDDGPLRFGEADAKEEHKKARRRKSKKKKAGFKADKDLLDSILIDTRPHASQLALLAELASEAMRMASEQAGEDVIYCCGTIRIKHGYRCPGNCQQRPSIKRFNEENRQAGNYNKDSMV